MKRRATAVWKGTGLEGTGNLSTQSGAFTDLPFSFVSRFKNDDGQLGTNPEELIAAAHAGCFNMALSFQLVAAGYTADELRTKATLVMEKEDGWVIKSVHLALEGHVPGIGEAEFREIAGRAKAGCPVSNVLNCEITMEANLG